MALPQYPTGPEGLLRDIEAFASITQEDKDSLLDNQIELTLLILESGEVGDAYARGNVSDQMLSRVEQASYKLHDFTPAMSRGVAVESSYSTKLTYSRYFPYTLTMLDTSQYEKGDFAWSMDIGGYVGEFSGEISDVYGLNGGMYFGMGVRYKSHLVNMDFGMGGAAKKGSFNLPPEVIRESNNVHFNYGISYSRIFEINTKQSMRAKLGIGGYSINAGFVEENNLYRFNGFDLYGELAYSFQFSKYFTNTYHTLRRIKHFITPFMQLHSWQGDEQSNGLMYNFGLRYSFESYGTRMKN